MKIKFTQIVSVFALIAMFAAFAFAQGSFPTSGVAAAVANGPVKKISVPVIKKDSAGTTLPWDGTTIELGLYPKNGTRLPNDVEVLNEQMFADGICGGTPSEQAACRMAISFYTGTFVLTRGSNVAVKPVNGAKIAQVYFSFHVTDGLPEGMASIDKVGGGTTNLNVIHFGAIQMVSRNNDVGMLVNGERFWGVQMFTKNLTDEVFFYGTLPLNQPIQAGQRFYMNPNHDNSSPTAYLRPVAFQTAAMSARVSAEDQQKRVELSTTVGNGLFTGKIKLHVHAVELQQ